MTGLLSLPKRASDRLAGRPPVRAVKPPALADYYPQIFTWGLVQASDRAMIGMRHG